MSWKKPASAGEGAVAGWTTWRNGPRVEHMQDFTYPISCRATQCRSAIFASASRQMINSYVLIPTCLAKVDRMRPYWVDFGPNMCSIGVWAGGLTVNWSDIGHKLGAHTPRTHLGHALWAHSSGTLSVHTHTHTFLLLRKGAAARGSPSLPSGGCAAQPAFEDPSSSASLTEFGPPWKTLAMD